MTQSLAIFVGLGFVGLMFLGLGWGIVYSLTPEHRRGKILRWMLSWWIKGFVLPLALWCLMNIGLGWNLQPFMQEVQAAQNGKEPWFPEYLRVVGYGLFILSSYWAAVSLLWVLVTAARGLEGETRSDFRALCLTCSIAMLLPAAGIMYLGGWPLAGLAAMTMLTPIAGYAPNILQTKRIAPMYARAVAKTKFGKYGEAEWEIIQQLEKCEDDFEGWMMLADLYANQFNDMREAEQTVLEICDQPRTNPSQVSVALQRLADWYLKRSNDPDAARRALQAICDRLPNTHLAHMSQLRMNQLPATAEDWLAQKNAAPIPLPALGDQLDEPAEEQVDTKAAAHAANACVEKLKHDPNNVAAREKLARLLAERLNQPEVGIEQITLLLNMPDQPEMKRAEWLGSVAAWHIRYRQDPETGKTVLERLVQEFPNSPQAMVARRRIRLITQQQI